MASNDVAFFELRRGPAEDGGRCATAVGRRGMTEREDDTCDDCPECRDEANWSECCAACHCCPDRLLCDACRPTTRT